MTSTQLRCERNSWHACAWAGTSRAPRTTATTPRTRLDPSAAILWFGLYVVAFLVLLGLAVALGAAFWFGAAAVLVLGAIATYVYVIGTMWWAADAGEPVLLIVGLPAEASAQLVNEPATGWYAKRWLSRNGSPAVWPVGRMLRRAGRRQRLDQLLAELHAGATQR